MKRRHQNINQSTELPQGGRSEEQRLSEWLNLLPDAPLKEDFTEQVLRKTVEASHLEVKPERLRSPEDQKLDECLALLPQVTLSKDFTQRVLSQTVEKDFAQQAERGARFSRWLSVVHARHWGRIAAGVCAAGLLTFGVYFQYNQVRIHQIAESLSTVAETATEVASVSETDLEAIQVLGELSETTASVDNDLWLAMVTY